MRRDPDGKREKYSRKYAFSGIMYCGFCGTLTVRRSWHSRTEYQKNIWQCRTKYKDGLQYCPHSKGIAEQLIENAFIATYNRLYSDRRVFLDNVMQELETTFNSDSTAKNLAKIDEELEKIRRKRDRLIDAMLESTIDKINYELKFAELSERAELQFD